ncbi:STAS domain-containing protein [Mycobacterium branderi]|uniref:Anti-sigma factor antagonist n=1 Tax=Mycobacterium branderi TaxID=43348 RepID=A0A7I7WEJ1_9MYCO|nr:STAS domain-containing protein [Mycobacterium branderi]MCV7235259.1 STAS domain-containing protein [Mycobacterium branderi]ORA29857.1 hypothetical protein BST20_27785 [Mycobacterium branderi]BBZ15031.1 anti-sigma factor antagonist [Mycobacterium branderi]
MLVEDPISYSVEHLGGVTVLAVGGEIDRASAPMLKRAVEAVLAEHPCALVIDLSQVRFLASAGLQVLVDAREKMDGSVRFAVAAQGAMTSRIIRLVQLDEFLSLHDTLGDALLAVKGADATETT